MRDLERSRGRGCSYLAYLNEKIVIDVQQETEGEAES